MNIFSTFHRKFISTFNRITHSDVLFDEIMSYILALLVVALIAGISIKIIMLILKLV